MNFSNKFVEENREIEFKKAKNSFPKEALKTYSAFANTNGGVLILGVDDTTKEIVGINDIVKIKKDLFDTLNNHERVSKNIITDDHVKEIEKDGKVILVINIPKATYSDKPIYLNNEYTQSYKRNYEGDYKCTKQEIEMMIRDASGDKLDSTTFEKTSIKDFDEETIRKYRQHFKNLKPGHPFNNYSDEKFLEKIKALRENRETGKKEITLGGLLVFGRSEIITEFLPHFRIEYINKIATTPDERWSDRVIYDGTWGEGNIFNFFLITLNKLEATLKNRFTMSNDHVTRKESNMVVAVREALVNTIIHADYKIDYGVKITRTQNCIYFENPGSLRISKTQFFKGDYTQPRNSIIQFLFSLIGICEGSGGGVPKILAAAREFEYKFPEIETDSQKTIFKLWDTSLIETISDVSPDAKKILEYIFKNSPVTNTKIREIFNLKKQRVVDLFNELIDKKYIEKIGIGSATKYSYLYSNDEENISFLNFIETIKIDYFNSKK